MITHYRHRDDQTAQVRCLTLVTNACILSTTGYVAPLPRRPHLTVDELLGQPPSEAKEVVAFRRDRREEYLGLRLPDSWTGQPVPVPIEVGTARLRTGDFLRVDGDAGVVSVLACAG